MCPSPRQTDAAPQIQGIFSCTPPPSCSLTGMLFPPGSGRVIFVRDSEGQG